MLGKCNFHNVPGIDFDAVKVESGPACYVAALALHTYSYFSFEQSASR
jgi:hypothetical protein